MVRRQPNTMARTVAGAVDPNAVFHGALQRMMEKRTREDEAPSMTIQMMELQKQREAELPVEMGQTNDVEYSTKINDACPGCDGGDPGMLMNQQTQNIPEPEISEDEMFKRALKSMGSE